MVSIDSLRTNTNWEGNKIYVEHDTLAEIGCCVWSCKSSVGVCCGQMGPARAHTQQGSSTCTTEPRHEYKDDIMAHLEILLKVHAAV
jgi:homoserine acetyltransferase